jgi:hypothetical protein
MRRMRAIPLRPSLLLPLLALGCAPAHRLGILPRGSDGAATATIAPIDAADAGARDRLLSRAAAALCARGLAIASRGEGRIVTAPRELDVPCGEGSCLARELYVVRASAGRASVELLRGTWEPAARFWLMGLAPATAADSVAREVELLEAVLDPAAPAIAAAPCAAPAAAVSLAGEP